MKTSTLSTPSTPTFFSSFTLFILTLFLPLSLTAQTIPPSPSNTPILPPTATVKGNPTPENTYAPVAAKPNELLVSLTYRRSPLLFPFSEVSRETIPAGYSTTYRFYFSNPFDDVIQTFDKSMVDATELPLIDLTVVSSLQTPNVLILGKSDFPSKKTYTVGYSLIPFQFTFTVERSNRNNGTMITVDALKQSSVYSGLMPVRSPFKPDSAPTIPFRWN